MKKVLVLMGGTSEEREVSLRSGKSVAEALRKKNYQVEEMDLNKENLGDIKNIAPDVVFIALHGKNGEDGTIQGYLDLLGIPYTGSGLAASAICMNKILTKKILSYEGLPTADFLILRKKSFNRGSLVIEPIIDKLGLPLVIKAPTQGSSIGTYIVKNADDIINSIEQAFQYDDEVLLEKFIDGQQLTASVIGNENPDVLPLIEITSVNEFYDYESKYTPGMCEHIIPARVSNDVKFQVEKIGRAAYLSAGCRGFARVDFMLDKTDKPYVLEINTIPGMTSMSLVPDAAAATGINYEDLVDRIIKLALEK